MSDEAGVFDGGAGDRARGSFAEVPTCRYDQVAADQVVIIGGDHTISYAGATAVARSYDEGSIALVHFDAHADTGEDHHG